MVISVPILLGYLDIKAKAKRKEEQSKLENELIKDIVKSIKNGTTSNIIDVDDLFFSLWDKNKILLEDREVILKALRKSKRIIALEARSDSKIVKEYLEHTKKLILEAEKSLEVEAKKAPFTGVEDPERGLLEDIHEASLEASKKDYIFNKLNDLASAIKLRNSESEKYIDEQKESLKLSRRGLWATVIFSLISIALAVYFYISAQPA
jgi:Fe2+ transport system protein B